MLLRVNEDIAGEIIRADHRGASPEEMKRLYIRRNHFDLELDAPIYRIVPRQYFVDDLRDQCLSHTKIDKSNWGDSSENPLLNRAFRDSATDGILTLNGVVDSVYGSCWSATPLDSPYEWNVFSHGRPSVRLQSTPGKLLNAVMSPGNPYYMLQHVIGKMKYLSEPDIEAYFSDPDWQKHLDSLGIGISASFLRLNANLSTENEVRLLYEHLKHERTPNGVRFVGRFAKVPFA